VICVVGGCAAEAIRPKGMCGPHYSRYNIYGDPLAPRPDTKPVAWLKRLAVAPPTDECVLWPFGLTTTGYSKVKWNGRTTSAHRVILELTVGQMPPDKHTAAHSCRSRSCVNPFHLRWATTKENMADKRRDDTEAWGERNGHSVLNNRTVLLIVRLHQQGKTPRQIANDTGINPSTVRDVVNGRTWRHVTGIAA
jgi:HNH endonuclease